MILSVIEAYPAETVSSMAAVRTNRCERQPTNWDLTITRKAISVLAYAKGIPMKNTEELARIFKALSAPTRVSIVQLLRGRALCVGALSKRLDVTQGAVSQHLRILRDAGLVKAERRGSHVHYHVNPRTATKWTTEMARLLGRSPEDQAAGPQEKEDKSCVPRRRNVRSRRS